MDMKRTAWVGSVVLVAMLCGCQAPHEHVAPRGPGVHWSFTNRSPFEARLYVHGIESDPSDWSSPVSDGPVVGPRSFGGSWVMHKPGGVAILCLVAGRHPQRLDLPMDDPLSASTWALTLDDDGALWATVGAPSAEGDIVYGDPLPAAAFARHAWDQLDESGLLVGDA